MRKTKFFFTLVLSFIFSLTLLINVKATSIQTNDEDSPYKNTTNEPIKYQSNEPINYETNKPIKYETYEFFSYYEDNDEIIITHYYGTDETLVIPDTINDKPVTGLTNINTHFFENYKTLESILIPKTITEIKENTFKDCESLLAIALSENTQIKDSYILNRKINFLYYEELARRVPQTTNDTTTTPEPIQENTPEREYVYTVDRNNEICIRKYNGTAQTLIVPSYIDGKKVVTIKQMAFATNKTLKKVIIPSTVRYIGDEAFGQCTSLEEVILPKYLDYIGNYLFYGCNSLKSVEYTLW